LYDITETYQIGEYSALKTYTPNFAAAVSGKSAAELFQVELPWEHPDILIMQLLCNSYLLQNGIAQGDRLAMANSVELRLPLVDYRLVEVSVGLQKVYPAYSLPPKQWLKDSVRDILPAEVVDRPKRGFNPPVTKWVEAIRRRYSTMLTDGFLVDCGVLDRVSASKLARSVSRFDVGNDLFVKYMVLESWCRAATAISHTLLS
jgi:asparagine synthase (glutamine-hydrolysing)